METTWRSSMGMSERMTATMKIMSACKSAFPDLTSIELQARAKGAEDEAFKTATSRDEYKSIWQERIESLSSTSTTQSSTPAPTTGDHKPDQESVPYQQIGRYQAKHHASGITSTVYQSTSQSNHTPIAIKLTTPHMMAQPHNAHREARLLRSASHKSIVPLLSTESIPGGHFLLIFPFLAYDFGSLLQTKKLKKTQVISHLQSLFTAIEHLHSLDIIHRDIKPSNLLLASPSGPAYLADFGIAWHSDDKDAEPSDEKITDVGTTCYRPPELLFGNISYGKPLDIWAAGCVVAEALQGTALFDAGDLGSELALVKSIFETLGTPNDEVWPEARTFRDWGKMQFAVYPRKDLTQILPDASDIGRQLVDGLVRYQSTDRLTATQALKHPFFEQQSTSSSD